MKRMTPDDRRQHILQAAVSLAVSDGYLTLDRGRIAGAAGVSPALVTFYFYSTELLLKAVMEEAVRQEIPCVVAEGLAKRCPIAQGAPQALKQAAIDGLMVGSV